MITVRENFGGIAIQEIILYSGKFSHGVKFCVFCGMLNTWHHSGLELKKQYTNVVQYGERACDSTVATLPVAVSQFYHLTQPWTAKDLILEQTANCMFVLALGNSSHRFAVR